MPKVLVQSTKQTNFANCFTTEEADSFAEQLETMFGNHVDRPKNNIILKFKTLESNNVRIIEIPILGFFRPNQEIIKIGEKISKMKTLNGFSSVKYSVLKDQQPNKFSIYLSL